MWAVIALFHPFGVAPSPFNSLDCFVNPCGDDKILMKIPSHLTLMSGLIDPEKKLGAHCTRLYKSNQPQ